MADVSVATLADRRSGETQASAVYALLRQDLISGVLAPDTPLRVRSLCERYGVGLNPLREALNRATSDGLVQQSDLRGFRVSPISPADLIELTQARCLLAEAMLRESIAKGDLAWEEEILLTYHRLNRIPRQAQAGPARAVNPEWEQAHRAFHRSIVGGCGSGYLLAMHDQLFDAADRYRHLFRTARAPGSDQPFDEHRAIVNAAIARDLPVALDLIVRHYRITQTLGLSAMAATTIA